MGRVAACRPGISDANSRVHGRGYVRGRGRESEGERGRGSLCWENLWDDDDGCWEPAEGKYIMADADWLDVAWYSEA